MKNFIGAGFQVFDTHPYTPHGWVGEGEYDYTGTDRYIESYLEQKPDALLILRFWMGYYQCIPGEPRPSGDPHREHAFWWSKENPGHVIRTTKDMTGQHCLDSPSFASLKWREEAGEALRRVVEHVETRYADRIFAYVPGGGPCGEWFHWFAYFDSIQSDPERLDDYSAPMVEAFQRGLREKYGTLEALNAAWGGRREAFEEIELPGPQKRLSASHGCLRDPARERDVIDFYDIFNRQVVDTLLHWAKKTKEGCGGNKIVMAFYGYLWHHRRGIGIARSGHVDLDACLRSPDIDVIVAPLYYSFRQMGGVISGQGVVSSCVRRGKQYLHELDGSTNLKPSWPCPDSYNPETPEDTRALIQRDVGKTMCEGASAWIMDLAGGMYDDPSLVEVLRGVAEGWGRHSLAAGQPNRQVAVLLNPQEAFYYREMDDFLGPLHPVFKQFELERMGLGYDDLILPDLEVLSPEETARYRLWIFPSAVHLTDDQLAAIRRHAFRNGNHVVWNYGVGVVGPGGLDLKRMQAITGFRCEATDTAGEVAVRIERGNHPFLAGVGGPVVYGTHGNLGPDQIKPHIALKQYPSAEEGFRVAPRFWIAEGGTGLGEALDLGEAVDTGPRTGLAARDMEGWISVLSVAPLLPKAVLREIARSAGCHVYTDFPGQSFHCRGYYGHFFHEAGRCRILLPERGPVVEVWSGRGLADDADTVEIEAAPSRAVLLRYGTGHP